MEVVRKLRGVRTATVNAAVERGSTGRKRRRKSLENEEGGDLEISILAKAKPPSKKTTPRAKGTPKAAPRSTNADGEENLKLRKKDDSGKRESRVKSSATRTSGVKKK